MKRAFTSTGVLKLGSRSRIHFFFSFFVSSFLSIRRAEFAVFINMSLWDSVDLGDVSEKVSWALFGPAFRKLYKPCPTQSSMLLRAY